MDQFLDELRQEGEDDSGGEFTVALDKAAWKLAEYQLTDPKSYPLHLLAAAVLGGATFFSAVWKSPVVTFRFDGDPLSVGELASLGGQVMRGGRLGELGVALSAAGSQGSVRLLAHNGAEGVELRVVGGQVSVQSLAVTGTSAFELVVGHPREAPDLEALANRGCFAPLELSLDGRVIPPTKLGAVEQMSYAHYLVRGEEPIRLGLPSLEAGSFEVEAAQHRSMALALAWPAVSEVRGFGLLINGVCYQRPHSELGLSFLCGLVAASDLKRDVSLQGVVEDQQFDAMMAELDAHIDQFLIAFCQQPTEMTPNHLKQFQGDLLARFQDRDIPPEVAAFLAASGDVAAPELLAEVARDALETDQWEGFERAVAQLRARAGLARDRGLPRSVQSVLGQEMEMLRVASRQCREWDELWSLWSYLCQENLLEHRAWAAATVNLARSPATSFRALMMSLSEFEPSQVLTLLREWGIPEAWWALLRFEYYCQGLARAPGSNFQLLNHLERAQAGQPEELLRWVQGLKDTDGSYLFWLELIWNVYRGGLSFPATVRLRATLSYQWSFNAPEDGPGSVTVQGLLKETSGYHEEQLFLTYIFSGSGLPLLLLRLARLRRQSPRAALELLGRALIQLSLGPLGHPLSAPATLPAEPSSYWA